MIVSFFTLEMSLFSHMNPFLMKLTNFVVINAGVAGCCTGLALSFPGSSLFNWHFSSFCNFSLASLCEKK